MTPERECDFCDIVARTEDAREVLRTELVVAFFPDEPATLGHTLVIPRRHVPDVWSLDAETAHALIDTALLVSHAIRDVLAIDGLNIIQSNGEAATQSVPHLHIHVVPRRFGDAMGEIWPTDAGWAEDELRAAQRALRGHLRHSDGGRV